MNLKQQCTFDAGLCLDRAHVTNWLTSGLKTIMDIFLSLLNYVTEEVGVTVQSTSPRQSGDCCAAGRAAAHTVQHLNTQLQLCFL